MTQDSLDPDSTDFDFEEPKEPDDEQLSSDEEMAFVQALSIGRFTDTIDILGHKIKYQTLTVEDELLIALKLKPYVETEGFPRAWKTAVLAAAITEIDDESIYVSITSAEGPSSIFEKKFAKLVKYHAIFLDPIYTKHQQWEKSKLQELADKLGKSES